MRLFWRECYCRCMYVMTRFCRNKIALVTNWPHITTHSSKYVIPNLFRDLLDHVCVLFSGRCLDKLTMTTTGLSYNFQLTIHNSQISNHNSQLQLILLKTSPQIYFWISYFVFCCILRNLLR